MKKKNKKKYVTEIVSLSSLVDVFAQAVNKKAEKEEKMQNSVKQKRFLLFSYSF